MNYTFKNAKQLRYYLWYYLVQGNSLVTREDTNSPQYQRQSLQQVVDWHNKGSRWAIIQRGEGRKTKCRRSDRQYRGSRLL
jgi:hypothetical protein